MSSPPPPPRSKRHSKSCKRCSRRKQRCHGFPVCTNCQTAKQVCVQSDFAIDLHQNSSEYAAFERIKNLEEQLAAALAQIPTATENDANLVKSPDNEGQVDNAIVSPKDRAASLVSLSRFASPNLTREVHTCAASESSVNSRRIADTVGFLSLSDSIGGEPAYVGSSSGFSLATSLGQLVQSTVWRKALASTISEHQPRPLNMADLTDNRCGPPNDEMGARIMNAYFKKTHLRYPFIDRREMYKLHSRRHKPIGSTPREQFGTFKLYMIYAIGSTMLQLTEPYNYTSPESYFITALQYISAARESHSINNIEAMMLLVLYNLRSPSNSGIWYMIGLAMRTAIDLGLHREAHYTSLKPYQCQLRRRLFWTVYFLDRIVAVSLGRPVSIADQDIDTQMPLDLNESIHDDNEISLLLARPPHLGPRETSDLTMCMGLIKLKRIESQIQSNIYRVDRSIDSLFPEVAPIQAQLCEWKNSMPSLTIAENDYLLLQYNKAIRLMIQPFLNILDPQDEMIRKCLISSGQICQVFKRMFQRDAYGHSFISVHSIFIAGVTICYCLCLNPSLWTIGTANDLSACSSALFVMAERTPSVRKYRDVLETVVSSAMDFVVKSTTPNSNPPPLTREDAAKTAVSFTPHEHQAVESLLGLSSLTQDSNLERSRPQHHLHQRHQSDPIPVHESNAFTNPWGPLQAPNNSSSAPQVPPPSTESIENWPMEPLFDFQWHNSSDPEASFSNGQDNMLWDGMGDLQFPGASERENVWAGDKHGLNMINKLLGIDPTARNP